MIHVSRLIQTSERNPSQWEGLTDDGECVYIRYRWGHLSIGTGKKRLGAVERLNLALLVHAQHQSVIGRVHVQPDNVAHFFDQQGVGRQFEGIGTMWLQAERPPNAADGHAAEPGGFGQTARAPMRFSARRVFQGLNDHPLDLGIAYLAGRPRSRLVVESFPARQHYSRPPSQPGLAARPMGQRLESITLFLGQNQRLFGSPGPHLSLLHLPSFLSLPAFIPSSTASATRLSIGERRSSKSFWNRLASIRGREKT